MSRVKIVLASTLVFAWSITPAPLLEAVTARMHGDSADTRPSRQVPMPVLPAGVDPAFSDPDRTLEALQTVPRIRRRDHVSGYSRSAFGKGWKDGPDKDGCDARNDVLADSLQKPIFKAGSDCVVIAGTLDDPYTGQQVSFRKSDAAAVQIDHLVPLAYAWDAGAARWPAAKRIAFANDPINLIAVAGGAKRAKSDRTPGSWMPVNQAYACTYVRRVALVAASYDLPLLADDLDAMRSTASAAC